MGCRILFDRDTCRACLYDSVTETAFGPCFVADDAQSEAECFLDWLNCDARILSDDLLRRAHTEWHRVWHADDGELRESPHEDDASQAVLGEVQQAEQEHRRKRRWGVRMAGA